MTRILHANTLVDLFSYVAVYVAKFYPRRVCSARYVIASRGRRDGCRRVDSQLGGDQSNQTPPNQDRCPASVLRDLCFRQDIIGTNDLVRLFNETTDELERAVVRDWFGQYFEWFQANSTWTWQRGMFKEFVTLTTISPKTSDSKFLAEQAFFAYAIV